MPRTGIELVTLQSLTWCSKQLSFAACQNYYYYLLNKQTFSDESKYNRQQFFVTYLHKIVTVFKKSTQKCGISYFKIAKRRSAAVGSALRPPVFVYYSYTALLEKYPSLSCILLNEVIKLCDLLCLWNLKI